MQYRHEYKFLVSSVHLRILAAKIAPFLRLDKNQKRDYYTVTSVYFDDIDNRLLQENFDGVDNRSKYRMRVYDNDFSLIKLEKKSKVNGLTRKESVIIYENECEMLLSGNIPDPSSCKETLKKELFAQMRMQGMIPKSVVEYDRTAYIYPIGNVRITFDMNIRGSLRCIDFSKQTIDSVPLLPSNLHILELKYDELLPQFIYDLLDCENLQQTAFSKYVYSRIN